MLSQLAQQLPTVSFYRATGPAALYGRRFSATSTVPWGPFRVAVRRAPSRLGSPPAAAQRVNDDPRDEKELRNGQIRREAPYQRFLLLLGLGSQWVDLAIAHLRR